jgi:hypothetical protein
MADRRQVICVLKRHYGSHRREISVRPDAFQSCDGRPNASSAHRSHCRPVRAFLVDCSRARASQMNGSKIESPLCNLGHFRRKTANNGRLPAVGNIPGPTKESRTPRPPGGRPDGAASGAANSLEATRLLLGLSSDQSALRHSWWTRLQEGRSNVRTPPSSDYIIRTHKHRSRNTREIAFRCNHWRRATLTHC